VGNATRLIRPRTVTGDGEGLVSHAGLVWLGDERQRAARDLGYRYSYRILASAATVLLAVALQLPVDRLLGATNRLAWLAVAVVVVQFMWTETRAATSARISELRGFTAIAHYYPVGGVS
jgi:hypothetical protein